MKAFQLVEINQLTQNISKSIGLLWLISALLLIIVAIILLLDYDWWWIIAVPTILLSQVLIVMYWQDAKYGTIANIILIVGIIIGYGNWNFNTMVKNELKSFVIPSIFERKIMTKEMINSLPPIIQKWLEQSNVIGKDIINQVHLKQIGKMRTTLEGKWMDVRAEQWFKTEKPGFIWVADVKAPLGISLLGRDKYINGEGHMLIKLLSLITVVDSKGKEIDQGTMLRYLGETIWFPTAVLNKYIQWEQVDPTTVKAVMNYSGITASGIFKFNIKGDIVSFEAKRYYERKGKSTLENWFIQIDPNSYKEFEGIRIPTKATVIWKLKEGDFAWYKLEITDINYN
ncbi:MULTISPECIES: DUF6544 family protein [unclassified Marinitoga]|uniref:DUF6544 family protein n=1 Tax=unclassified Marinitoga TaxID=2640159 RepID=UPI0012E03DEA|nr:MULTISPECIES: DUF6544 family protein [unclassified Marinitoga]